MVSRFTQAAVAVTGVLGVLAGVSAVEAAVIPWSNAAGSNAQLSWSDGGSTDALWGSPTVSGSTFLFSPPEFRVESSNGVADTVDGLLQVKIQAAPGKQIEGFTINESGFYTILGLGSVKASGVLKIRDLDTNIEYTDLLDTAPVFPVVQSVNPFGGVNGSWSGEMFVDLPDGVTRIEVVVNNNLQALSVAAGPGIPGSTAFIDKKFAGTPVSINVLVPEPATVGLVGALGGLLLLRRRQT